MYNGLDTSFNPPDYTKAYAAGHRFVLRYVSPSAAKNLTVAERDRIWAAGLKLLGLNWENAASDALRGFNGGVADAKTAVAQAKSLGMPSGQILWFSAGDFDVQPHQFSTVDSYFQGVKSVVGSYYKLGCYAGRGLLKHLKSVGLVQYYWQACVPWGWYDNGPAPVNGVQQNHWASAHVYQVTVDENLYNGDIDRDVANSVLYPQLPMWSKPGTTTPPPSEAPVAKVLTITRRLDKYSDVRVDTVGALFRYYLEILYNVTNRQAQLGRLVITSNFRSGPPYHGSLDDKGAVDIAAKAGMTDQGNKDMRDLSVLLWTNNYSYWLELIHTTPFTTDNGYYVKDGRKVSASYYGDEVPKHLNHVHTAMTEGKIRTLIAATLKAYGITKVVYGS